MANRSRETDEVDRYCARVGFDRIAHMPDIDAIRRSRLKKKTLFEMDDSEDIVMARAEYLRLAERLWRSVADEGLTPGDRLEGSIATATWAATMGAAMIRVHDVRATVAALDAVASADEEAMERDFPGFKAFRDRVRGAIADGRIEEASWMKAPRPTIVVDDAQTVRLGDRDWVAFHASGGGGDA